MMTTRAAEFEQKLNDLVKHYALLAEKFNASEARVVALEKRVQELESINPLMEEEEVVSSGATAGAPPAAANVIQPRQDDRGDDEDDETGSQRSLGSVSAQSQMEMFRNFLAASNVKIPFLKDLEKENIRQFMSSYAEYEMQCPPSLIKPASRLVKREFLDVLAAPFGVNWKYFFSLSNDDFFKCLCGIHAVKSVMEVESQLKRVKMKADDLAVSTLVRYNQDFEFCRLTVGDALEQFAEKNQVKVYVNGLRPNQLVYAVKLSDPKTLEDAMKVAMEQLDILRTVNSQAKYFNSNQQSKESDGHKKQKKDEKPSSGKGKEAMKDVVCYRCGQTGHIAPTCTNAKKAPESGPKPAVRTVQMEVAVVDTHDGLCRLPILLKGSDSKVFKCRGLLDTGANIDCVDYQHVQHLNSSMSPLEKALDISLATSGVNVEVMGTLKLALYLSSGELLGTRRFHVIRNLNEELILSYNSIVMFKLIRFLDYRNFYECLDLPNTDSTVQNGTNSMLVNEGTISKTARSDKKLSLCNKNVDLMVGCGPKTVQTQRDLGCEKVIVKVSKFSDMGSTVENQAKMGPNNHTDEDCKWQEHSIPTMARASSNLLIHQDSKKFFPQVEVGINENPKNEFFYGYEKRKTEISKIEIENPKNENSENENPKNENFYTETENSMVLQDMERIYVNNFKVLDNIVSSYGYAINEAFPECNKLAAVIQKYAGLLFGPLDTIGLKTAPMQLKLRPNYVLKSLPPRFLSKSYMDKVKADLDKLVSMGILVPTDHAEVASPLVIIKKPDGDLRIAVDYRELNAQLSPFAGSIPDVHALFPYLAGKAYYAKLDNLSGYHQLRVAESDQHLTTITTIWGLYRFTRCPFGISTAPGIYQHIMAHVILKDVLYKMCVVFIDDTIVFGSTMDEFLHNLDAVLALMARFNVRLKPSKCFFGYPSVLFLGMLFDATGYSMTEERKESVINLPLPSTLSKLRSFLGMCNYFRDFIPQYSLLVAPLTEMTKTDKFTWSDGARAAFTEIKEAIARTASLRHIQGDGRITLYTDASTDGIGGFLAQVQEDGIEFPILFISKKFSDAATRWSTLEQECFAVYYCVIRLEPYLLGRHFFVATDHKNLLYLQTSTIPKLVRWRLRLMEFSFTVVHIPGKSNVVADALSRVLVIQAPDVCPNEVCEDALNPAVREELEALLCSIHNEIVGHHGLHTMLRILRQMEITWPHMREDVSKFLKSCAVCQKIKHNIAPAIVPTNYHTLSSSAPMLRVSADTIGPLPEDEFGNSFILVIIDEFSRYTQLFSCPSTEAVSYAQALLKHVGWFGVPSQVRTDGGTQFTAHVCTALMQFLGTQHIQILAYHPQANGIVERRNAEVMKHLRAIVLTRRVKQEWSLYLPLVQNILNSAFCSSIQARPNDLIFGTNYAIDFGMLIRQPVPPTPAADYIAALQARLQNAITASNNYLEAQAQLRKAKYHEILEDQLVISDLQVGDYVLVTYPTRPPHKLSPLYRGPFTVVEILGDNRVRVSDFNSAKTFLYHVDRLRLFKCADNVMPDELAQLAAADSDEFIVEAILGHRRSPLAPPRKRGRNTLEFLVRWEGFDPASDSWEPYSNVRSCAALDVYSQAHPELRLG